VFVVTTLAVFEAVTVVIGAIWHHVFVHSRRKNEFQNGYARKRDDLGVVLLTFSCTAVSNRENRTAMHENVILGVCHAALAPPEALVRPVEVVGGEAG